VRTLRFHKLSPPNAKEVGHASGFLAR
jgi:hypothetical protein